MNSCSAVGAPPGPSPGPGRMGNSNDMRRPRREVGFVHMCVPMCTCKEWEQEVEIGAGGVSTGRRYSVGSQLSHLKIPLGGEGLLADVALEGLVACVGAHVDLQRRAGAEVTPTDVAEVLVIHRRIQTGAGWAGGHERLLKVQRTSGKAMRICKVGGRMGIEE